MSITVAEGSVVEFSLPRATGVSGEIEYVAYGKPLHADFIPPSLTGSGMLKWEVPYSSKNGTRWISDSSKPGDHIVFFRAIDRAVCQCVQYSLYFNIENREPSPSAMPPPISAELDQQTIFSADGIAHFPEEGMDSLRRVSDMGFKSVGSLAYGVSLRVALEQLRLNYPLGSPQLAAQESALIQGNILTLRAYLARAHTLGIKVILRADDVRVLSAPGIGDSAALLAIEFADEMDLRFIPEDQSPMNQYFSPESVQLMSAAIKAAGITKPLVVNFSSRFIGLPSAPGFEASEITERYREWIEAADIVSFDHYPISGSNGELRDLHLLRQIMTGAVHDLRKLVPSHKPILAFVEAVDYTQGIRSRDQVEPISLEEFRAQTEAVLFAGASGVRVYGANGFGGQTLFFDIHPLLEQEMPFMAAALQGSAHEFNLSFDQLPAQFAASLREVEVSGNNAAAFSQLITRYRWDADAHAIRACVSPEICTDPRLALLVPSNSDITARLVTLNDAGRTSVSYLTLGISPNGLLSEASSQFRTVDRCSNDSNKLSPGVCGCGTADADSDLNGLIDCIQPPPETGEVPPAETGEVPPPETEELQPEPATPVSPVSAMPQVRATKKHLMVNFETALAGSVRVTILRKAGKKAVVLRQVSRRSIQSLKITHRIFGNFVVVVKVIPSDRSIEQVNIKRTFKASALRKR